MRLLHALQEATEREISLDGPVEVQIQGQADEWGRTVAAAMYRATQPPQTDKASTPSATAPTPQNIAVKGITPEQGPSVTSPVLVRPIPYAASPAAAEAAAQATAQATAMATTTNAVSKDDSFEVEVVVELPDGEKHEHWKDAAVRNGSAYHEASNKEVVEPIIVKISGSEDEASDVEDSGDLSNEDEEWDMDENYVDYSDECSDVEEYWNKLDVDDDDSDADSDDEDYWVTSDEDESDDSEEDFFNDSDDDSNEDSSDEDAEELEYGRIY